MTRAVNFLVSESRLTSNISSVALISFVLSVLLVVFASVAGLDNPIYVDHPLSILIGVTLAVVLTFGLLAMLMATWIVLQRRNEIDDWAVFLALIWLIPYLGVAVYLGSKNIISTR